MIIDDVNFLNNADLDGKRLPPAGAPNVFASVNFNNDNRVFLWNFHVDFVTPANTVKTLQAVAPTAAGNTVYC